MKILLDSNLSYRLVNRLIDIYPECIHVSLTDLIAPARDAEIWNWAKQNRYIIIVSNDEDFRNLLEQYGSPPKVVLLRTGNLSTSEVAQILRNKYAEIYDLYTSPETDILEIFR
ncbi:MAG: DUF5615 family PIN-like protein [Bacteroidetes bacterium]|nr:DUF5615 family PIN-like protein [Bacteroidota bacterium]